MILFGKVGSLELKINEYFLEKIIAKVRKKMFFPEKLMSIRSTDSVLEIGPGGTPHYRSNAFLELLFDDQKSRISQRGGVLKDPNFGNRPVYYYDGGVFPFDDGQFDYVICCHVIEHVQNPVSFISEINRISSGRGYLEYPLITYEYLYNFNVHLHFMKFDFENRVLRYLPKNETALSDFTNVNSFFNETLEKGWDDLCAANKKLFFEGLEYNQPIIVEKTSELSNFLPPRSLIIAKRSLRWFLCGVINKLRL